MRDKSEAPMKCFGQYARVSINCILCNVAVECYEITHKESEKKYIGCDDPEQLELTVGDSVMFQHNEKRYIGTIKSFRGNEVEIDDESIVAAD